MIHSQLPPIAFPPPSRFASFISEYFLEKITPAAPFFSAAVVDACTSSGVVFFSSLPVGISISIPGKILTFPPTASTARFVSRPT